MDATRDRLTRLMRHCAKHPHQPCRALRHLPPMQAGSDRSLAQAGRAVATVQGCQWRRDCGCQVAARLAEAVLVMSGDLAAGSLAA